MSIFSRFSKKCAVADLINNSESEDREIIKLSEVRFARNGNRVLDNINITVKEGRLLGIIGPNGAGKTTLLRIILGIIKPGGGEVCVLGMSPKDLKKELHHIGYVPQQVVFDHTFPVNVFDVVMMGRTCCIGTLRFPRKTDREAVMKSIESVGLSGLEKRPIGELSGGQQKRAFLARALCLETKVLLLDEPTAGLDIEAQENFLELLNRLKEEMRLTVVFVSHDVNVLSKYADEIACINRSIHLHGSPQEVLDSERLKEAYKCEFDFLIGKPNGSRSE